MSFKMIREAQALARLGSNAKEVQVLKAALGVDSVIGLPVLGEGTGPENGDWSTWLSTLVDHASEAGINIAKKADFFDLAHEMFDNDPKMGSIGGGHKMREKCATTLWHQYQMNKSLNGVHDHADSLPQENEETSAFKKDAPLLRKVTKAPVLKAAVGVGKTNPYPAGSLRASLWDDMHASEDEEYGDGDEDADSNPEDMDDDSAPMDQDNPDDADTDSMSPDQLAVHITGVAAPSDDEGDDAEGGDDLEGRVDDLEARVSGLEGGDNEDLNDGEDGEVSRDGESDEDQDGPDQMGDDEYDDQDGEDDPVADVRNKPEGDKPRAFVPGDKFTEEEELSSAHKSLFHAAITQPKQHMAAALKDMEDQGATSWLGMQMPRCPHPKGSAAHNAWQKGFKNSAMAALGINPKPRDPKAKPKKR